MIKIGPPSAPHILRWHLLPRNRLFNVWLHKIISDDPNKELHTHPSWNISLRLKGDYIEEIPANPNFWPLIDKTSFRDIPRVAFRSAGDPHRITLRNKKAVWTLFFSGNPNKAWGFWEAGKLVSWRVFALRWRGR